MRKLGLIAAIAVLAAVIPIAGASAGETSENVYIALGDSVAAGTQQPEPFTDNGYTDVLYGNVADRFGLTDFVNFACPADDSFEMIDGDDNPAGGSLCYGSEPPLAGLMPATGASQLDVAVEYINELHEAGGTVGLITLTMGANDLFRCDVFTEECIGEALTGIGTNLQATILPTLRAVAPEASIVAMNYYNSSLAYALIPGNEDAAQASNALVTAANGVLEASYGNYDIPVVNVAEAFGIYKDSGQGVAHNVRLTCKYTLMCDAVDGGWELAENPDIHPSNTGYARIARAFNKTIKENGLR